MLAVPVGPPFAARCRVDRTTLGTLRVFAQATSAYWVSDRRARDFALMVEEAAKRAIEDRSGTCIVLVREFSGWLAGEIVADPESSGKLIEDERPTEPSARGEGLHISSGPVGTVVWLSLV